MVHRGFKIGAILTEENRVDTSEIIMESYYNISQDFLVSQVVYLFNIYSGFKGCLFKDTKKSTTSTLKRQVSIELKLNKSMLTIHCKRLESAKMMGEDNCHR